MNVQLNAIARAALELARGKLTLVVNAPPRKWQPSEVKLLQDLYAEHRNAEIASRLGRSPAQIQAKAHQLGLLKSDSYLAAQAAHLAASNSATRFQSGHSPWNAGKKGLPTRGRTAQTQFKKGNKPHTWLPVGSERTSRDGYLQRKVSDTGYPPRDWKGVHILLWEEHNGPVPTGHCICFKDGIKTNITLANLELLSRAERMSRNTIHRYPTELKSAIRTVRKLERVIREVEREKQD